MDYIELLRRFAINDPRLTEDPMDEPQVVEPQVAALMRLAALVAVGGAEPTYGAEVADAVSAGATTAAIVDVLTVVVPIVGLPSVVAAAPKLALALGVDPDEPDPVHRG